MAARVHAGFAHGHRRHALTDYLANYQTFITTTDADLVIQHFTETCHIIPLK